MTNQLELLDAWRAGDGAAGSALLADQFDRLYRFFGSKAPAQDVGELIQRTLLACVENRDAFQKRSSFSTYVFAIARSVLVAFYRARARAEAIEPERTSIADLMPSPSSVLGRQEEQRLLLGALRRLSIDHQILIELHYWESLTGPELAAVFEVPEQLRGEIDAAGSRNA